jgi:hypothetical protein
MAETRLDKHKIFTLMPARVRSWIVSGTPSCRVPRDCIRKPPFQCYYHSLPPPFPPPSRFLYLKFVFDGSRSQQFKVALDLVHAGIDIIVLGGNERGKEEGREGGKEGGKTEDLNTRKRPGLDIVVE